MKNYHDILFPYAYNIIGSSEDAKDIVQDILIKYLSVDKAHIKNEIGYLIKSVVNHSINFKKKKLKTVSRDTVWLPEPIATETANNTIEKEDILSYSMLVLLEKLTAKERAVFILKEAYNYSHQEISETIDLTINNSRKLLSRAKTKLGDTNTTVHTIYKKDTTLLSYYIDVMKSANITALEKLLTKDIQLAADGGKDIKVVRELTTGIVNTSKLLLYVFRAFLTGLDIKISHVNHQPAILFYKNETLYNCQVFEIEHMKIKNIYSIVDPKKLKSFSS